MPPLPPVSVDDMLPAVPEVPELVPEPAEPWLVGACVLQYCCVGLAAGAQRASEYEPSAGQQRSTTLFCRLPQGMHWSPESQSCVAPAH
jgi:hypothetical protein